MDARREPMMRLPAPADAARLPASLHDHPRWSVFWDNGTACGEPPKMTPTRHLYAESRDLDTVLSYITAHS